MANSYGTATNTANITAANSAANGTYSLIGQYDLGAAPPHELLVEVKLTPSATPSSVNKQSVLLLAASTDGTNWSDAPTTATESNSRFIGSIAHPDATARQAPAVPVSPHFGGVLPRYLRVYVKNDTGVAYAASGHSIVATTETLG